MSVVVAIRQPDVASEAIHSFICNESTGASESIKTVREELLDVLPAPSVAKNLIVVVPCESSVSVSVQLPARSAVVVAWKRLFETVDDASAVPRKIILLDVAI